MLILTRRMAYANWTCASWVAYAPGTIAVNVTWIEREFNACQTSRSMYPPIFNHFWDIVVYRWRVSGFQQFSWANERFLNHVLLSPGYAPGTIAVNVTWIEREFNTCQTHRSMYTPIFNRLRAINVTRLERGFNACKRSRLYIHLSSTVSQ